MYREIREEPIMGDEPSGLYARSRDAGRNIGGSTVDAEIPGKADRTTYYYDLY